MQFLSSLEKVEKFGKENSEAGNILIIAYFGTAHGLSCQISLKRSNDVGKTNTYIHTHIHTYTPSPFLVDPCIKRHMLGPLHVCR